jgi:lysophospholipid acyltransferase (LPLAT)-like uncharacterized protein
MKSWLLERVLPLVAVGLIRVWCLTLRMTNLEPSAENHVNQMQTPCILTLWHGRIFYLFYHLRNRPEYHLLISPSKDGDFLARLALLMGYSVVRGSSYKKAVSSARTLIKILRKGGRVIIIADGSRGPCEVAQTGSLELAAIASVPVIPMTWGARRKKRLNSWDRFVLPLPFSTCTVKFGRPIEIKTRSRPAELDQKQKELQEQLNKINAECDQEQSI